MIRRSAVVLVASFVAATTIAQDRAPKAPAKSQAPASVAAIQSAFDKKAEAAEKALKAERLAALEAYVGDKANASRDDLQKGRLAAAGLAADLEKWAACKTHASAVVAATTDEKDGATRVRARLLVAKAEAGSGAAADVVKKAFMELIEGVDLQKNYTVQAGFEATQELSEHLAGLGDKTGVEKAWEALTDRIPDPQLSSMAQSEVDRAKLIGETPKAFPEGTKDLDGKPLALGDFSGKVVLIDFWATWCGPCIREIPHLVETYAAFKDKGFEIVGVSLDDADVVPTLPAFLKEHGMTWRQTADGKGWESEIGGLYGVKSIPATYLLDRKGRVHRVGLRGEALTKAVEKLLAEKAS